MSWSQRLPDSPCSAGQAQAAPLQDPSSTFSIVDLGSGANEVWAWRSAGSPQRVLIFCTGRATSPGSAMTPGSTISRSAYGGDLPALRGEHCVGERRRHGPCAPGRYHHRLRRSSARPLRPLRRHRRHHYQGGAPVQVAGFGYGATLAFDVATSATVGTRTPYAVDSIFPAVGSILGFPDRRSAGDAGASSRQAPRRHRERKEPLALPQGPLTEGHHRPFSVHEREVQLTDANIVLSKSHARNVTFVDFIVHNSGKATHNFTIGGYSTHA